MELGREGPVRAKLVQRQYTVEIVIDTVHVQVCAAHKYMYIYDCTVCIIMCTTYIISLIGV